MLLRKEAIVPATDSKDLLYLGATRAIYHAENCPHKSAYEQNCDSRNEKLRNTNTINLQSIKVRNEKEKEKIMRAIMLKYFYY